MLHLDRSRQRERKLEHLPNPLQLLIDQLHLVFVNRQRRAAEYFRLFLS